MIKRLLLPLVTFVVVLVVAWWALHAFLPLIVVGLAFFAAWVVYGAHKQKKIEEEEAHKWAV